jgi:5-methylcytosine-specific restriction endonuclease McrA
MPKTPRTYIPAKLKQAVIKRAQGRCEYCQCRADYATETFAVEHIIPLSRGGKTVLGNLALACSGCNGHKYNRLAALDPLSNEIVPLFHPRRDRWQEHFGWNEDYTYIVGLTPTGRATVAALVMNSAAVINLRAVLYATGKHPPQLD